LERATGQRIGKRQVERLTADAAVDFEAFYSTGQPPAGGCGESSDLSMLSCDGKGVVMRPDAAAGYLTRKARYLDYPTAPARGWPIATGVIEGACRHLLKDRLDITGARWGLPGAEAILKLRALTANHDFDDYWRFDLAQERHRVHELRSYAQNSPPQAA
jgi:hypothetical protein